MIPLVLSTYNRTDTLQRVLSALQVQTKLPDKLIVFSYGPRNQPDDRVSAVRAIFHNIDQVDKELIERPQNFDYAPNIINEGW